MGTERAIGCVDGRKTQVRALPRGRNSDRGQLLVTSGPSRHPIASTVRSGPNDIKGLRAPVTPLETLRALTGSRGGPRGEGSDGVRS